MDSKTIDGEDPLDLVACLPKMQFRVWKHLFDMKDLDNHVPTTIKEVAGALEVHYPNVATAIRALLGKGHLQKDGIHFYINPYHWWYGDDWRKEQARDEWDKRKELNETDR